MIDAPSAAKHIRAMYLARSIMALPSKRLQTFAVRSAARLRLHRGTLPDFIILGAQKAGTTSLHAYLREHPDVLPCAWKEVHYFDGRNFRRGDAWYRRQFLDPAGLRTVRRLRDRRLIGGEATPYYLFQPQVPERIAQLVPKAKLIALLRDPVARAYSQYQHNVRKKMEPLSFGDALKREDDILPLEHEKKKADPAYRSQSHHRFSYKMRGCYAEQVERFYRFFPHEQLLIVKSEDLFEQPRQTYASILDFLELPLFELDSVQARNAGDYSARKIPEEDVLRRFFEPHNRQLYDLIGRDMGW